jgi:menaquinone-dependent protoporphyrinogen oxidase
MRSALMNVLIAYGSRHGATREIASAIARGLERFGVKAEVRDVHTAGSVEPFDAVIIGSAVYMGR